MPPLALRVLRGDHFDVRALLAEVMGQTNPHVTWKHYAKLYDRSDVNARVRAAQASLDG